MSKKHSWTYAEDYICCFEYLDFVFDNVGDDNINKLVDIIAEKLPHIKRESVKMKVKNIKQVALDAGLEDRLEFSPLKSYSNQCKNAFDSAVDNYMEAKRNENYIKEQKALEEEKLEYEKKEKEQGGTVILSQEPSVDFFDALHSLIGADVSHKLYGDGVIIERVENYITVKFERKTAKFPYPESIGDFLIIKDQNLYNTAKMHQKISKNKKRKERLGYKYDLIEDTPQFIQIEEELEALIRAEIGERRYLGFCHLYWMTKEKILKERFGIDWKSPSELNPHIMFD